MKNHKRLTIVALAITAAWSSATFAEDSPAVTQCIALFNQKTMVEAGPHCAQAAEEPGKKGKLLYANWQAHSGDFEGAKKRFTAILAGVDFAKPTQVEYSALRDRAFLGLHLQEESAETFIRAALKLAPDDVPLLKVAAERSPSADQRLECADRLIALDPKSVEAHVWRSYALTFLRKGTDGLAAAETAAKLDPNSLLPLIARGFAYRELGEYAKAEREYAAAARKAPNDPDRKIDLAEMLGALKRYEDAINVLTAALKVRPDYAHVLRMRAGARLYMGDAEGALADAEASIKIEPNFDTAGLVNAANEMLEAQKAMRPETFASMEQDRRIVFEAIKGHMHRKCGHYSLDPDNEDNDGLNAYRDCIEAWYQAEDDDLQETVGSEALAASSRYQENANRIEGAAVLQCSNMPKNSRCIPAAQYARALELTHTDNAKQRVGVEEFERLNREVIAFNRSIKRQNALINTANFLNAVARGLSGQ